MLHFPENNRPRCCRDEMRDFGGFSHLNAREGESSYAHPWEESATLFPRLNVMDLAT